MPTDPPPARPPGQCHCRLIDSRGFAEDCPGTTSGPDDPFCPTCTSRHPDKIFMTVTTRPIEVRS